MVVLVENAVGEEGPSVTASGEPVGEASTSGEPVGEASTSGEKGAGKAETFVDQMEPEEAARYEQYWSNNAPKNSTPGAKFDHYKYNNGVSERSTVIYDNFGRQQYRIDYNNHGYSDHSIPHLHEYKYGPGYENGWEFRWNIWR